MHLTNKSEPWNYNPTPKVSWCQTPEHPPRVPVESCPEGPKRRRWHQGNLDNTGLNVPHQKFQQKFQHFTKTQPSTEESSGSFISFNLFKTSTVFLIKRVWWQSKTGTASSFSVILYVPWNKYMTICFSVKKFSTSCLGYTYGQMFYILDM